jgi:hypothetical protein
MRCLLLAVAVTGILLAPAGAKDKPGKGKGHNKGHNQEAVVVFVPADRSYLRGLPPGLAKRDDLPPGLQKQLRRNGRLPPGLEKKLMPFPAHVEARLPPCPPEVHRGFIGGVAVMYNSRTGLVLDFVALAGR